MKLIIMGRSIWYGEHSIVHIENLWANLKKIINSIYGIIPKKNYGLFLKEAEFRYNITKLNKDEKINLLKDVFKEVYEHSKFTFDIIGEI